MRVYLITNEHEKYKIGFTSRSVQDRIKELQTGSHASIHLVNEYESENAKQIETVLHRNFRHKKVQGEWFDLNQDDVREFKSRCEQIDRNISSVNAIKAEHTEIMKRII